MNIGIYIFEKAEVLDFSGPFEVFTTAARVSGDNSLFNVFLIGQSGEPVSARAGFRVVPHYGFHAHPKIDVLVVSGGVHGQEMLKPEVLAWVAAQAKTAKIVASVCTGAFILAQANVLRARKATTHWEDIAEFKQLFPKNCVVENVRWVEDDNIFTSGGITAGIDMSLQLVSKLCSLELAMKTAKQMEFIWTINSL
jgi:transcriptional regulator GlxA family with amidase domain